ncbi:hypothetical protein E2C01_008587 [Portunus trituberculatus]|uniref:Uncharacterized protein n=1 Tax=Portunus trituberculatus TaxID=210409 RepID=A0A5B7D4B1_PORTR|nr:hypothetical protein [Portunus trituberculatus]
MDHSRRPPHNTHTRASQHHNNATRPTLHLLIIIIVPRSSNKKASSSIRWDLAAGTFTFPGRVPPQV